MLQEQHPQLTDKQYGDFERAKVLAWKENEALDRQTEAARGLAIELGELPEGEEPIPNIVQTLEDQHDAARQERSRYRSMVSVLMPDRGAFETSDRSEEVKTTKETIEAGPEYDESFASREIWAAMTLEQRKLAINLREAIASSKLADFGVTKETLRLVATEPNDKGESTVTIAHNGAGIPIHDLRKVDPPNLGLEYTFAMTSGENWLFNGKVNGQTYNTRLGMTDAVYVALVADATARGIAPPDSEEFSQQTGTRRTRTILTGETVGMETEIEVRSTPNGRDIHGGIVSLHNGPSGTNLCIRPAVYIGAVKK